MLFIALGQERVKKFIVLTRVLFAKVDGQSKMINHFLYLQKKRFASLAILRVLESGVRLIAGTAINEQ